ncbi:hypothetical protein E8E12_007359 [Didymella heteroderae]|uniref:Uncharacterized protein n=1 Tax=Didymella heteroderae TaxID=1769908 RepID=A0A9P5C1G5_9PLEO|nr:hypothetical protein E8E12_007359 [Didymella heteroderae]
MASGIIDVHSLDPTPMEVHRTLIVKFDSMHEYPLEMLSPNWHAEPNNPSIFRCWFELKIKMGLQPDDSNQPAVDSSTIGPIAFNASDTIIRITNQHSFLYIGFRNPLRRGELEKVVLLQDESEDWTGQIPELMEEMLNSEHNETVARREGSEQLYIGSNTTITFDQIVTTLTVTKLGTSNAKVTEDGMLPIGVFDVDPGSWQ